jgi:DDE family transposase
VAVDCCLTKAPCGGEKAGTNPVDRGKQGIKRSTVVDAKGIPLGAVAAPANRHDSPLLDETLDTLEALGELPEQISVHLDGGYDSRITREKLEDRGLLAVISEKGKPAPLRATRRWVVENALALGITPTRSWCGAPNAPGASHRFVGSLLRGGHHRKEAHPRRLDSLPLGGSASTPTLAYWRKLLVC